MKMAKPNKFNWRIWYIHSSIRVFLPYTDYSYSVEAKAVALTDAETDYYAIAVKQTDISNGQTNVNWQVYKSLEGVLDWSGTSYLKSIVTWEDEFGQDLNGDGDFTGTVSVSDYGSDTDGATLGKPMELST